MMAIGRNILNNKKTRNHHHHHHPTTATCGRDPCIPYFAWKHSQNPPGLEQLLKHIGFAKVAAT